MNIKPQMLDTTKKNFNEKFISRLRINSITNKKTQSSVNTIIANIKKRGDTSLISYVKKYDGYNLKKIKDIFVTKKQINEAYSYVDKSQLVSVKKSISRIRKFAKKQKQGSWSVSYTHLRAHETDSYLV